MKKIVALIMVACLSIGFSLFNQSQTLAAILTRPVINSFDVPIGGDGLTISWQPVLNAVKYYIGMADVTVNEPGDSHLKVFQSTLDANATSCTIPIDNFIEGNKYKLILAATDDSSAKVDQLDVYGSWSWSQDVTFVAELSPLPTPVINNFEIPKAGEDLTITWNAIPGAKKYYVGMADVTNGDNDNYHVKEFYATMDSSITSCTIPGSKIIEKRIYKLILAATRDSTGEIEHALISGNWSWSKEVKFIPKSEPAWADVEITSHLEVSKYLTNDTIYLTAELEGKKISYMEVTVKHENSKECINRKAYDNNSTFYYHWNTSGRSEGEYIVTVSAYDVDGNLLDDDSIIIKLEEPEAEITIVEPAQDGNVYLINNSVNLSAEIQGYGFKYSRFTIKNHSDIKNQSEEIKGSKISYTWETEGYPPGEYTVSVSTYDGNGKELDCKEISITLESEEPASAEITLDLENGSEYTVKDVIKIHANIEGNGFTKSKLTIVRVCDFEKVYENEYYEADIMYKWDAAEAEAGEYFISIETYDSNNDILDLAKASIALIQPKITKFRRFAILCG